MGPPQAAQGARAPELRLQRPHRVLSPRGTRRAQHQDFGLSARAGATRSQEQSTWPHRPRQPAAVMHARLGDPSSSGACAGETGFPD